mmetsp:Transcript_32134/g.88086  ORF Transcript_32134/g.88086 Transcript_32134/m.88086 type:complete len:404 (+) Transcript_32134:303-1514(+)
MTCEHLPAPKSNAQGWHAGWQQKQGSDRRLEQAPASASFITHKPYLPTAAHTLLLAGRLGPVLRARFELLHREQRRLTPQHDLLLEGLRCGVGWVVPLHLVDVLLEQLRRRQQLLERLPVGALALLHVADGRERRADRVLHLLVVHLNLDLGSLTTRLVDAHRRLELLLLGVLELGERLLVLRNRRRLARLERVRLRLLDRRREVAQKLAHHLDRDGLAQLVQVVRLVPVAKVRPLDVPLGGPRDVVGVAREDEADGERAVERLAMVVHLACAVGLAVVAKVLGEVPEHDVHVFGHEGCPILEALTFVEVRDSVGLAVARRIDLALIESHRHLHPAGAAEAKGIDCLVIPGHCVCGKLAILHHELDDEREDAEDLHEILRGVELGKIVRVLGRGESIVEEILS